MSFFYLLVSIDISFLYSEIVIMTTQLSFFFSFGIISGIFVRIKLKLIIYMAGHSLVPTDFAQSVLQVEFEFDNL